MALRAFSSSVTGLAETEYFSEITGWPGEPSFVSERKGEDKTREQLVDVLKSTYVKTKDSSTIMKSLACDTASESRTPPSRRSFRPDFEWIREHSISHRGEWVALKDGKLLDSDKSRRALWSRLKQTGWLKGVAFFKVEQ